MRISKSFCLCVGIAGIACLAPSPARAVVVTYYTDQISFQAAVSSLQTVDFEGIVPDNGSHFYGAAVTIDGVDFTEQGSHPPGLTVVGKNAAYAASSFYSAFLGEGNGNGIIAGEPGEWAAVGANVGDVYNNTNTTITNGLTLTLIGNSGLLDTRTVDLHGMATGGQLPLQFAGYIVTGDSIQSIEFAPGFGGVYLGIDNLQFESSVPEPGTFAIAAGALGLLALRRGRRA